MQNKQILYHRKIPRTYSGNGALVISGTRKFDWMYGGYISVFETL